MGARGPKPGDAGYRPPQSLAERIRERVVIDDNGCWLWQGSRTTKGYVIITVGSRIDGTKSSRQLHRVAYEVFVGPIPDGLTIDHTCEVKHCCSPTHLEPVTNAENKRRGGERMAACRRGHPRTTENTYVRPDGKRQCRVCRRKTN